MERVLTPRELNRATLARQLLLRRARLPLVRGVERIAGLQAQWAPAPYVGLWTRLEGFRRDALQRALRRNVVARGVLMRATVHVVSLGDYARFAAALDVAPPSWITPEAQELAARVREPLRAFTATPRTKAEIYEWLERDQGIELDDSVGIWYALRIQTRIAHAPESSGWKVSGRLRFVAVDHEPVDPSQGRMELVRRYLAAFGPATRAEIANWSGVRVRDLLPALEGLEPLRRFRDEQGRELYDLPRAPIPAAETPAPVRFLPKWDNTLLDRRTLLPDEYRAAIVRSNADVEQTFLVDGLVAGIWRYEDGRVTTRPFEPLPRPVRREVEDEAARLAEFLR
jgi:Winged helix DNA-binding domain